MARTKQTTRNNKIYYLTSMLNAHKKSLKRTTPVLIAAPKFYQKQQVSFMGGNGIIKGCHKDSGTWTYTVEMPLCQESGIARIGPETTILLQEADINIS